MGRGRGEMSSLLAADGRTSLMSSSDASRSSFRLNSFPIAPEDVSVESPARTRTGVGVADLAVFGLNKSCERVSEFEGSVESEPFGLYRKACTYSLGQNCIAPTNLLQLRTPFCPPSHGSMVEDIGMGY